MNLLPVAHSVTLMRNIYMKGAMNIVFNDAPQEMIGSYIYIYGLEVNIGNSVIGPFYLVLAMIVFALVFLVLSVLKLSKSKL